MFKLILLCVFMLYTTTCETYKVLVLFPLPSKSHSYLGDGVVRHLLEAGHEVTYITAFPKARKPHPLLREIDVNSLQELASEMYSMLNIEDLMNKEKPLPNMFNFLNILLRSHVMAIEHVEVQKLLSDPKEKFDVLVAEWIFTELYSGIAAVYNCPLIWVSTVDPHWAILRLIDEVTNPAYTNDAMSSGVLPFSFPQRVMQLLTIIVGRGLQYFYIHRREHEVYERLFVPIIQKRGHLVPDLEDLRYNASLILGNSHVSLGSSIRLPQNYIDVGGYHVNTNVETLPKDFQEILDKAKNGLIYFSMGSNLHSKDIPMKLKADLLTMFRKFNQTVVWKFEEDLPEKPHNVYIMKWAPQQQILAHRNCVLFITHGGLLSITETIHFGKPIIGIPVYGDQFNNVDRAVNKGFAKRVDLSYTMTTDLENAINDILTDPSYSNTAQRLSLIYHDRPTPPGRALLHWVEHVARTGGAPHLRSPALLVPWYQKLYLDLAALVLLTIYCAQLLLKKLYRTILSNNQKKKKRQ